MSNFDFTSWRDAEVKALRLRMKGTEEEEAYTGEFISSAFFGQSSSREISVNVIRNGHAASTSPFPRFHGFDHFLFFRVSPNAQEATMDSLW